MKSIACKYEDFSTPWYQRQEKNLKIREIFSYHSAAKVNFVNRKFWEWCSILEALETRSFLTPGFKGLDFACVLNLLLRSCCTTKLRYWYLIYGTMYLRHGSGNECTSIL
jgi:hypothetical protein